MSLQAIWLPIGLKIILPRVFLMVLLITACSRRYCAIRFAAYFSFALRVSRVIPLEAAFQVVSNDFALAPLPPTKPIIAPEASFAPTTYQFIFPVPIYWVIAEYVPLISAPTAAPIAAHSQNSPP